MLHLHGFQVCGYLKSYQQKVSLHHSFDIDILLTSILVCLFSFPSFFFADVPVVVLFVLDFLIFTND